MRISAAMLATVGTAAGGVAAVLAYQTGVGASTASVSSPQDDSATTSTTVPAPQVSRTWLPCEKGTTLRKGECVRVKKRVVVVTDPAPAAPPGTESSSPTRAGDDGSSAGHARPATSGSTQGEHGDESTHHEAEHADETEHDGDEAEHESEHESGHGDEAEHADQHTAGSASEADDGHDD